MNITGVRLLIILAAMNASTAYKKLRALLSQAWVWMERAQLISWIGARLFGASKAVLEEPLVRSSFISKYRSEAPRWKDLVQVNPALSGQTWKRSAEAMEVFEKLFDRICKFSKVTEEKEALKSELLSILGTLLDFSAALQSCGSCRLKIAKVRSQYNRLTQCKPSLTKSSNSPAKRPPACLEDLWTCLSNNCKSESLRDNCIVFEARALALRYSVQVEIIAFIALFGLFLRRFSTESLSQLSQNREDIDREEDLASLFMDAWEDAIRAKGATRLKPCFSELAALRMGLSVRPKRF